MNRATASLLKIVFTFLFIGTPVLLCGQVLEDRQLYAKISFSASSYIGGNFSLDYVSKTDVIVSSGIHSFSRKARNLPDDYEPPLGPLSGPLLGIDEPWEELNLLYIATGKSFKIKDDEGFFRINLTGGIGVLEEVKLVDFVKESSGSLSNYTFTIEENRSFAVVTKGHIEKAMGRGFGVAVGYTIFFSKDATLISGDFSILIGLVGKKKSSTN